MKRFDAERDTIFLTLAGSHAHGTAHPGSDVDLRGVAVAPLEQRLSYRAHFEQYEGPLPASISVKLPAGASKVESTIFDVAKLVRLAVEANPNALEILFASPEDWLLSTPRWRRLYDARRLFLSCKVEQTYSGYALAQLRRIQSHRGWLLHPPERRPLRADFGLPEGPTLGSEARRAEAASLSLPEGVVRALEAERRYRSAQRRWESYERWKRERNPRRAELEARYGYDTKHAMHLIRLMRSGLELIETGELQVRRSDAAELLAIRDGQRSYEDIVSEAERLREHMAAAVAKTELPAEVDHERIEALLFELLTTELG